MLMELQRLYFDSVPDRSYVYKIIQGNPPRKVKLQYVTEKTYLQDANLSYDDFPLIDKGKYNDAKL